jgi:hypothetical protein
MMNWRRRSYSFDGLAGLGFVIVAWAGSLVAGGFIFKLMWILVKFGWSLV